MVEKSPDAFRTISEAAQELEVPQHVLRFWETRFSQIKPMKRAGGRRFYRPADVELLKGVRSLLYKEGYTIRGVQNILKEEEYGDASLQRTFWENRYSPLYDDAGRITGLTVFVTDITERREAAEKLAKTQEELRVNIESQLKQLRGIIPICSYCKKIRNDDARWQQLETYISAHSAAMFSHGICPTCYTTQLQILNDE